MYNLVIRTYIHVYSCMYARGNLSYAYGIEEGHAYIRKCNDITNTDCMHIFHTSSICDAYNAKV